MNPVTQAHILSNALPFALPFWLFPTQISRLLDYRDSSVCEEGAQPQSYRRCVHDLR